MYIFCASLTSFPLIVDAQADRLSNNQQNKCNNYYITKTVTLVKDSVVRRGILVKDRFIECQAEFRDSLYKFTFGHGEYSRRLMTIPCATNQPDKLFNGHFNQKRTGIWFGWYPWGNIRKAVLYDKKGTSIRKLVFRPNGNLAWEIIFKKSKQGRNTRYAFNKLGYLNMNVGKRR